MAYQSSWVNTKVILVEEQQWHYLIQSWRDKGVHTFIKVISPKVKVWPEFELAYFVAAVHRFNYYDTNILPCLVLC